MASSRDGAAAVDDHGRAGGEGVGGEEQIRWAPYARGGLAIDTGDRER
jgi:hypothetical protein